MFIVIFQTELDAWFEFTTSELVFLMLSTFEQEQRRRALQKGIEDEEG